jgi:hypothetical protein
MSAPGNAARLVIPDRHLGGTRSSHRWAEMPGNWDRLNTRALFPGDDEWGVPLLPESTWIPARLVAYNDRAACDRAAGETDVAVHTFLDDYRFEVAWTKPERALSRVMRVGAGLTPDFSLWADMPMAMQLWQVYRSRWCGAWWASHGVRVIPTISWSTPESYRFAFAGIATGSVVAISSVGTRSAGDLFAAGYREMLDRLRPSTVLVYGDLPKTCSVGVDGPAVRCYPTRWRDRSPAPADSSATCSVGGNG